MRLTTATAILELALMLETQALDRYLRFAGREGGGLRKNPPPPARRGKGPSGRPKATAGREVRLICLARAFKTPKAERAGAIKYGNN